MEHLVVRLQDEAAPAQWAVFDEDGRVVRQAQAGLLSEAAELAPGRRVVVLVPGVEVVLTETVLPKASPARLRKMLPFSLEDTLAEDVEELAFAVGRRLDSGAVGVAVVARARLEPWLERLSAAGLSPHAVYSDADGVPDTPQTLTLIVEGERIYGRAPDGPAFVFEGLSLGQVVDVVDAEGEQKHAVVYVDEAGSVQHADDLRGLGERIASTQVKLMSDGALYRLGATLVTQPGTNLLQGEYAPKSNIGALLKPWRAAAALFLAFVLVSIAAEAAEYASLRRQSQTLNAQLTEICQQQFSATVGVCERVVRQRLSDAGLGRREAGFLSALTAIAEARAPETRLSQLQYMGGRMTIELIVEDVPSLDAFEREIEQAGVFSVTIQSTNPATGESRIELVEAGAERR